MSPARAASLRRLALFVVSAGLLLLLLWRAGGAVLPFALGLVFAYLVAPIVQWVDRTLRRMLRRLTDRWERLDGIIRPLAIIVTYLLAIGTIVGALVLLSVPVATEVASIRTNAPTYAARAEQLVDESLAYYDRLDIPEAWETEVRSMFTRERLQALGVRALGWVRDGATATVQTLSGTFGFLVASLVIPFWLFYVLSDTERVHKATMALIPGEIRPDVEAVRIITDRILSAYIRGQLLVALSVGVLYTLTLLVLGVPYAVTLGSVGGALAIVPFVGTILGAIPALLVALLQSPVLALQVLIAFALVQQLDNLVISPRVQGESVSLNPGVIMVVVVIGQAVMGLIGLVVAVPLAAILRDVIHFLYLRIGEDPVSAADAMTQTGYGPDVNEIVRGEADLPELGADAAG